MGNFGRENSGFEPKFWEIFSFFEFDKNWYKNIGRMGDQKSRKIAYVLCERSLSSKIERSMGAPNHVFQPLIFCPIFFHYISVIQIKYQFYWAKKNLVLLKEEPLQYNNFFMRIQLTEPNKQPSNNDSNLWNKINFY